MTHLLQSLSILKYTSTELIDSIVLFSSYTSSTQNSECAIFVTTTDNVYALGCNPAGHLGVGDFNARLQPTKLPTLCGQNVIFAEIRYNNTTALTKNGEAYIWGDNYYGEYD
jgi:alpha-tubulin suppressor-like RCC1 family protein